VWIGLLNESQLVRAAEFGPAIDYLAQIRVDVEGELGLALVKGFVELRGGTVAVHREALARAQNLSCGLRCGNPGSTSITLAATGSADATLACHIEVEAWRARAMAYISTP